MSVTVNATGNYTLYCSVTNWTFGGSVGAAATGLATNSSTDNVGTYSEISFFTNGAGQAAGIRLYENQPVILFSDTYLAPSVNNLGFPNLTVYPGNLYRFGYAGEFAGAYVRECERRTAQLLCFDGNFNSFIFWAATNFMIASDAQATARVRFS